MSNRPTKYRSPMIAALDRRCERDRLTNVAVAEKIGVSEGAVRFWRKIGRPPKSLLARRALAAFLGLELPALETPVRRAWPCPAPKHPPRKSKGVMRAYVNGVTGRNKNGGSR